MYLCQANHALIYLGTMNKKKIIFILNPISGTVSKAGIPGLIEERLDKEKFDCRIAETKYAGHATELAQQAARQGIDIVVAVGGDGTVNEVGRALVNTKTAMGILPCGSGNGLARHLNLPMNLKKCIDILNDCDIHTLDYGLINRHPFFCTCGMGFDAFISMKFAEAGKRGPITYMQKILEDAPIQGFPRVSGQCVTVWEQCLYRSSGFHERRAARHYHHGTLRPHRSSAGRH